MRNNCKVDFMNHEIQVTMSFLNAAQHVGTQEFDILVELQQKLPAFSIVIQKHSACRRRIWNPTYSKMREYIVATCESSDMLIEEFEKTILVAKVTGKGYSMVRRWFLENIYRGDSPATEYIDCACA